MGLGGTALAVLGLPRADKGLAFESEAKPGWAISDMSMRAVLRRKVRSGITVHGFRSAFRDWAGEPTGFRREAIEPALAHGIKGRVEAAYARSELFDKRRKLVDACATVAIAGNYAPNVVSLAQAQTL